MPTSCSSQICSMTLEQVLQLVGRMVIGRTSLKRSGNPILGNSLTHTAHQVSALTTSRTCRAHFGACGCWIASCALRLVARAALKCAPSGGFLCANRINPARCRLRAQFNQPSKSICHSHSAAPADVRLRNCSPPCLVLPRNLSAARGPLAFTEYHRPSRKTPREQLVRSCWLPTLAKVRNPPQGP